MIEHQEPHYSYKIISGSPKRFYISTPAAIFFRKHGKSFAEFLLGEKDFTIQRHPNSPLSHPTRNRLNAKLTHHTPLGENSKN